MGLADSSSEFLEMMLSAIPIKFVNQYRLKLLAARDKHDIMFLYKLAPLSIVADAHLRVLMTNQHIRNEEESKKTPRDIIRKKQDLDNIIIPKTQGYCGQTYSRNEREKRNSDQYHQIKLEANKAIFDNIPDNMDKMAHIKQVNDFQKFIQYNNSPLALHNHMTKVTGKQIPKNKTPIPITVFKDTLTQIELTDYNNSEKAVI